MFKYILISIVSICVLCFLSFHQAIATNNCVWSEGGDIASQFDSCLEGSQLIKNEDNMLITEGFRSQVVRWTTNIATLLWLLAIGSIVYGWLLMTLAGWEEEKIKKWKDILKWSLIWFIALISASAIIRIVIEFIFAITTTPPSS